MFSTPVPSKQYTRPPTAVAILLWCTIGPVAGTALAEEAQAVTRARRELAENERLAEWNAAFRLVSQVVLPSVVRVEVQARPTARVGEGSPLPPTFELPPGLPDTFRRFFEEPLSRPAPDSGPYREYDVPQRRAVGSGWVYDPLGHVVTNHHVVDGADAIVVKFSDQSEHTATIVGQDPRTDIALLKVESTTHVPARLAEQPVQQGDIVFAFGSPLEFEFSMSQGIVSGTQRRTGLLGPGGFEDFIQTDAAINPGNSGGPLVNVRGEVVGMNAAIASRSGLFSGVGFAVPTRMIRGIVEQLIQSGQVRRGFLGISIQDEPEILRSFGYEGRGVIVSEVIPGMPGERAGLRRGTIITRVDGQPVTTVDELRRTIAAKPPGSEAALTVFENGRTKELSITLASMPAEDTKRPQAPSETPTGDELEALRKLGLTRLRTLTPELARQLDIDRTSGALVEQVRPNSAAASQGLRPGVLIIEANGKAVRSVAELARRVAAANVQRGLRLTVAVQGRLRYVFLKLPD